MEQSLWTEILHFPWMALGHSLFRGQAQRLQWQPCCTFRANSWNGPLPEINKAEVRKSGNERSLVARRLKEFLGKMAGLAGQFYRCVHQYNRDNHASKFSRHFIYDILGHLWIERTPLIERMHWDTQLGRAKLNASGQWPQADPFAFLKASSISSLSRQLSVLFPGSVPGNALGLGLALMDPFHCCRSASLYGLVVVRETVS